MVDRYLAGAALTKIQAEHIGLDLRRWKEDIGYLLLSDVTPDMITKNKNKLLNELIRFNKTRSPTSVI